jgi:hypothetical protein
MPHLYPPPLPSTSDLSQCYATRIEITGTSFIVSHVEGWCAVARTRWYTSFIFPCIGILPFSSQTLSCITVSWQRITPRHKNGSRELVPLVASLSAFDVSEQKRKRMNLTTASKSHRSLDNQMMTWRMLFKFPISSPCVHKNACSYLTFYLAQICRLVITLLFGSTFVIDNSFFRASS